MFNRRINKLEDSLERVEEKLDSLGSSEKIEKFSEIKIKYKDKSKGLIFCSRCKGTGVEDNNWYGSDRACRFCEGKGYLKLKAV